SDSGFANKVFTKDAIPEGSAGTTAVQVSGLAGAQTYFWHWKSLVDGVASAPSPTQSFNVMPQVIVSPPTPVEPASGGTASVSRPTFTVNNAARTGPAGAVTYDFQVSTSSSFSPVTASATVAEQSGRTSWTPA